MGFKPWKLRSGVEVLNPKPETSNSGSQDGRGPPNQTLATTRTHSMWDAQRTRNAQHSTLKPSIQVRKMEGDAKTAEKRVASLDRVNTRPYTLTPYP